MLDINITLFIQLVNFIVTLAVLDFLLIKPIRGIIKKRRAFAGSIVADTQEFVDKAAATMAQYEAILAKAREEAAVLREALTNEALAKETSLLEAAREEAHYFLQTSREETKTAVSQATADMNKRIPDLSRLIVEQLLGKSRRSPSV